MVTHYILQMLGSTFLAPVSKHFFWVSLRVCNTTLYPSVSQPMCMTAQPRSLLLSSLVSADEHQQPSFLPMSMQTYSCFTLLSQAGSHITAPLEIKADPWNKDLGCFLESLWQVLGDRDRKNEPNTWWCWPLKTISLQLDIPAQPLLK